ncbi:Protein-L-isoaspartate O-methyltransferase [Cupriavidus sp. U2]|nr:Protein-L-isoaspartate O-methyltransferase [Cupriavidus sp. U2]
MVALQLRRRGIVDARVLQAMSDVPREQFVPVAATPSAYDDAPLGIGQGQTISQPYIVARMIEAARLSPAARVLEIGTGSGYSAAVTARVAAHVVSVERHGALANAAAGRLAALGISNVEIHIADGTLGWPAGAPYDAIIATAGGPRIPDAWIEQLAPGGALIMPLGALHSQQTLVRLVREADGRLTRDDLGQVMFVPLIGEQGWEDPRAGNMSPAARAFADAAIPLPDIDAPDFADWIDRFGDCRVVLLGESSHGTSEFYRARARATQRLIERHGFTIVAVEADWPDAASIDRYVRQRPPPSGTRASGGIEAFAPFSRFPTWMWRNQEVAAFVQWLRSFNAQRPAPDQAGFFGLDLYSMKASMASVLAYLDRIDPAAAAEARQRYACLDPWRQQPAVYGRAVLSGAYSACEDAVIAQLQSLLAQRIDYGSHGFEDYFDAAQNARLVASAEQYYRLMYYGAAASWNLRDTHMFDVLTRLLDAHGQHAKAVVWAHNSHIGNAAATAMGTERQELNIGQLCRERFGTRAALIGQDTYAGTVAAASDWDGPMEVKRVLPARTDSYGFVAHEAGVPRAFVDLRGNVASASAALRAALMTPRQERFIGVIYRPETELVSHYARAVLPEQFDGWIWFEETSAVTPLPGDQTPGMGMPETWPFGL